MSQQVFFEREAAVPEEDVDALEALVRHKFDLKTGYAEPHQMAAAMLKTFKGFDLLDHRGSLDKANFKTAMVKLNCADNKHAVNALFDRYDQDDKASLNANDFCRGIFGLKKIPQSNAKCRDVIKIAKEKILARGGKNGVRSLTRILRLMDDNGNRKLDKVEIGEGLGHYGVELTPEELDTIFYFFDRDNSGSISITEFLVGMRGKMAAPRVAIVKQAYTRLDKNDDRMVTMEDIKAAYKTDGHPDILAGTKTQEDVLREFIAGWDKNGDDMITEEEFIDYYKDISVGIDNDQYFELMIRNAWHIAGGKGMAENTTNRRVLVTHLDGSQTIECIIDDLGLGNDKDEIKAALRKQGVNDILRISLNA